MYKKCIEKEWALVFEFYGTGRSPAEIVYYYRRIKPHLKGVSPVHRFCIEDLFAFYVGARHRDRFGPFQRQSPEWRRLAGAVGKFGNVLKSFLVEGNAQ